MPETLDEVTAERDTLQRQVRRLREAAGCPGCIANWPKVSNGNHREDFEGGHRWHFCYAKTVARAALVEQEEVQ